MPHTNGPKYPIVVIPETSTRFHAAELSGIYLSKFEFRRWHGLISMADRSRELDGSELLLGGITQEPLARRFGLRLDMVRGWEDRTRVPDAAAVTLLRVIWQQPEAVRRVVAAE